MGRVDGQVLRKAAKTTLGRPIEGVRQRFGLFRPDQIGAGGAPGEDGSAAEQRQRRGAVKYEIAEVLRRVPRGSQSSKCQAAKVNLLPIFKSVVYGDETRGERCEDGGPVGSQLAAARDEIGMEMGLGSERDPQVEPVPELEIGRRITSWVDNQRPAVAERHQV